MDCSAGCTEIAGPFEIQYGFSLVTMRVKIVKWPAMRHRRRHDSRILSSSASRIARIRRLLICTPTKWPGVGQTSSTHEVWNHRCGFRPRTYQPDCVTQAREVGRLTSENSPALKVDACIRRLRVRDLLACTTTNHPCIN